MLDAVWGFNHIRNTRRAMKRLAFVSMTGVYLPVCLPFGPVNGPEDFQRMMHKIFKKKLFREWFIFLDDIAVEMFSRFTHATNVLCKSRVHSAGFDTCRRKPFPVRKAKSTERNEEER